SGLAGLLKPIWLSLICKKLKRVGTAATASPRSPRDFGTPPKTVHKMPVPAHTMHSSAPLRLRPESSPSILESSAALLISSCIIISFVRDGGSREGDPT